MADSTKVFEFASKRKTAAKSKVAILATFEVDGETFSIRPLKDSSVAYLVHKISGGQPSEVISAVLNFTNAALIPEDAKRFEALVLDPEAGLELEEVVQVFEHILEVVSDGTPTSAASDSSASPRKTGSRSPATARTRASGSR